MLNRFPESPKLLTVAAIFIAVSASPVRADEIRFLCASALQPAMVQLIADFEKASGHKVAVSYANVGTITEQIRNGANVDLGITSPEQWESLHNDGRIASDPQVQFAKVGLGFAVRKGAAKPELGSTEAVRLALVSVRGVAFGDPAHGSPSGADALRLFDRLGIAALMKVKSKILPGSAQIIQALAEGDVDLGIIHTSVIAASTKLELASLPQDLRYYTIFVASFPKSYGQAEPARAFARFLVTPGAAAIFKSKGIEPG